MFDAPDTESDYETQNQMIDDAVAANASAICLSAVDYDQNADAVERAIMAGVDVVMLDSFVDSAHDLVEIGTDNYIAGKQVGEKLLLREGPIDVAVVNFYSESGNAQDRERGFLDAISGHSRVNIVETINSPETSDGVRDLTIDIINSHAELDAIVTFNEITTVGVGEAIRETSTADDIYTIGFDNNTQSVRDLENGYIDMLIVQNPSAMGYLAVQQAFNIINNIKIKDKTIDTQTICVDRENMFQVEVQKLLFPIIM